MQSILSKCFSCGNYLPSSLEKKVNGEKFFKDLPEKNLITKVVKKKNKLIIGLKKSDWIGLKENE
tara:strand:- start:246 stop:440 length:195 start_codon:yes stop_codon:yes gene_type:complete